jgi:hypothetical protein
MTFDEIQRTIEQMLAVQRELQESQLRLQESQARDRQDIEQMLAVQRELQEGQLRLQESQLRLQEDQLRDRQDIALLLENSIRQQRLLDRLIGYSITTESNHLDLEERLNALERKVRRLEDAS